MPLQLEQFKRRKRLVNRVIRRDGKSRARPNERLRVHVKSEDVVSRGVLKGREEVRIRIALERESG